MLKTFLISLTIIFPFVSFADENVPHDNFTCGASNVEIFNNKEVDQPFFFIKISNSNQSTTIRYSVRNEFLFVRCDSDFQKSPVVLLNHICGGTGCSESNFGIINARTLEVLLTPTQDMPGNGDKAKKIMGSEIKPFSCKSCSKTSEGSQGNGEYCYISPIELGLHERIESDLIFANNRLHSEAETARLR